MRQILLAGILISFVAAAEEPAKPFRYNGYGYTFFSAGTCQHRYLNVAGGAGAEGFLWRGLTLGIEGGYYDFPSDRSGGYGVFVLGPGYHFVNRKLPRKFDPFVNVGLAGIAIGACGRAAAGSIGGGVNYWFKEKVGLLTGVQAQVIGTSEAVAIFRVGLTFR